MMRKLGILCLSFMMMASLSACGTSQGAKSAAEKDTSTVKEAAPAEEKGVSGKAASDAGEFDLEKGTVLLNSGYEMPVLGIGCFRLSPSQAEDSVYWTLRDGYRLIDTARIYGNEEGVGRGIQKAIDEGNCTREEIFVTTKMWTDDYGNGDAAIDASLGRLNLDYIDAGVIIGTS